MLNYQTWLENPDVVRTIIVQAEYIPKDSTTISTRYLSTHPATVDGIVYEPIISNALSINESISTSYAASISYGDIEIVNAAGDYDSWLQDIWVNKAVRVYVGSIGTTALSDYELIFSGLCDDIDSKSRTRINLKLRDKLEKLNTSLSEVLLGNYFQGQVLADDSTAYQNQYKNNLKPIIFGEVHNISPLLTDSGLLEYMVNLEAVEKIIEVRDNGVPVPFTTTGTTIAIPAGSFRLLRTPAGTITCSVQGIKRTVNISGQTYTSTYTNTISNAIATILKFFGNTLNYSEIEPTSFANLGTQGVGVYVTSRVNVLQLCQEIAKSAGLIVSVTRTGQVKLLDLSIPTSASISITEADMLLNTLAVTEKLGVIAGIKLGYAKNWTVQNNLLTNIPQQHKDLYAKEWLEANQSDDTVRNNFSVSTEATLENTYLITAAEAEAIALKKLNLFKQQRKVISMTCTAKYLSVQVGDAVQLTASRFGLNSGVLGRVVSTKPNWLRGTTEIGVLI